MVKTRERQTRKKKSKRKGYRIGSDCEQMVFIDLDDARHGLHDAIG